MPRSTAISDKMRSDLYKKIIANPAEVKAEQARAEQTHPDLGKAAQFFSDVMSIGATPAHECEWPGRAIPVYNTSKPEVVHHHHHHNSGVPWWLFFLMNRNANHVPAVQSREEQHRNSNFTAYAGYLIIVGVAVLPALGGTFYLLSELCNNFERLYYNEGYLQAGLGIVNIILSLSLSAVLTNAVLSSAITTLAVSAGFANPISWAFFILGSVTLFVAACVHLAIQEGIYRMTAHYNPDALHPEEPGRFTVTDEQITDLKRSDKRGMRAIDGDKMQNVITAIHHDMTDAPSRMQRVLRYSPFFRDAETAERLREIRRLRTTGQVDYSTETDSALRFCSSQLF